MARKRIRKIPAENGIFSKINFTESYTSLILGAIVVLVIGILFFSFAKGSRIMQTSSTKEEPKVEQQKTQEKSETVIANDSKTSSTYTIKPGDDLWSISENVYNDGYKWTEIARVNKLENPGLIHVGNKLTVPTIQKDYIAGKPTEASPKPTDQIIENNSIAGNNYTIKPEDNLWDICVRAYGDGYKWAELAKVNNISNPDLIYPDNVLKIPRSP